MSWLYDCFILFKQTWIGSRILFMVIFSIYLLMFLIPWQVYGEHQAFGALSDLCGWYTRSCMHKAVLLCCTEVIFQLKFVTFHTFLYSCTHPNNVSFILNTMSNFTYEGKHLPVYELLENVCNAVETSIIKS